MNVSSRTVVLINVFAA
ncbi:stress response membrane protein YncL, partial [Shigella sonnei]|nr:stress response membrane protein YncL [Shigella sonnei]EFW8344172.1 stress response membrane protein YncL [Shigella boydii]EIS9351292.1 stress response membrane protein YncL [Escherichia coli]EJH3956693.1 stress response membrane protein YncL [Shigella sonnei]EKD5644047.1 stress response membrane protein YncL [Shigella sonnei]